MHKNGHVKEIAKYINDLASSLTYKSLSCYKIEILKVISFLVSDDDPTAAFFKGVLREGKILRDAHAYHSPVFKNEVRNILEQTEELKETPSESGSKGYQKLRSQDQKSYSNNLDSSIVVNRRDSRYLHDLRVGFNEVEPKSGTKLVPRKLTSSIISAESFDDFDPITPHYIESRVKSIHKHTEEVEDDEESKNSDPTQQETKDENDCDALDQYLHKLKASKESPVTPDEVRIEVGGHRKSGKSSSPARDTIKYLEPLLSKNKDSTNFPMTSSNSSEDPNAHNEQEDNLILNELEELYNVFYNWIFTSKNIDDQSRPIRYPMMLPLCLNLSAKSSGLMKQRVIADFTFLTTAVEKNSMIIMSEKTFGRWILDLLYTVFPPKADIEKDPIWEMGCKLYVQVNKLCFNTDENAHDYIHQLVSWPINRILQVKSYRDNTKSEVRKKERMVRTLLFSLFDTLSGAGERIGVTPSISSESPFKIFWYNMINCLFYIEELILSFGFLYKNYSEESTPKKTSKGDQTFLLEYSNSLCEAESDTSLYSKIGKGLFFSTKNKWHDARLLDTIFEILEPIWQTRTRRRSSKLRKGEESKNVKASYNKIEDDVLD